MTPLQKKGAVAAGALTVARSLAAVPALLKDRSEPWRWRDTALHTAAAITDKLDGDIARATDGITPLGKALDPAADKLFNTVLELEMVRRGELDAWQLYTRVLRDLGVSALRAYVSHETNGKADIGANISGKITTAGRLATNILATSPAAEKLPRLRNKAQLVVTLGLVASGAYTSYKLLQQTRRQR